MVTEQDKEWLRESHPGLVVTADDISGAVEFSAFYNENTNTFLQTDRAASDIPDGILLDCQYDIRIQRRSDKRFSHLPALLVEAVDPIADRHFGQHDRSACLCSPLAEEEFLIPEFNFPLYMKELVVPFLYAQTFYSIHKHWPFPEFSHEATGLLESYFALDNSEKAELCLQVLSHCAQPQWERINALLFISGEIKGHMPCLCPKRDHIRRCHPTALAGLRRLKEHIGLKNLHSP